MTDEHPTDDEVTEVVAELEEAGLLNTGVDAEGNETWTLTPMGKQVATQLALSSEDDAAALLDAREG